MMSKTFNLFISHSWTYSNAYENLIKLLDNRSYFFYNNFSIPRNDPIHTKGTDRELYKAIKNKILPSNVVLIMAGVYASHSKWIDKEIRIAKVEFSKPKKIIAIEPWGAIKTSAVVKANADMIVGWNTESIISAIRELS